MMSVPDVNTLFFTIALMFALFTYSCFAQEYKPVDSLNLKNYDGRWYQVYKDLSDMSFQGFGTCAVADYVILSGNNVSVLNSQIDKDGSLDQISGYAFYSDGNSGGQLTVDLEGTPGNAPYWVIELGPLINNEYQYSIVSDNLKVSLFVLARNVTEFYNLYDDEVKKSLESYGFTKNINKPLVMEQIDCDYSLYVQTTMLKDNVISCGNYQSDACNCVYYARDRQPQLVYGLDTCQDKKNAVNSKTPQPGCVMMRTGDPTYCHVTYVTKVDSSRVYYDQANWTPCKCSSDSLPLDSKDIFGYWCPKQSLTNAQIDCLEQCHEASVPLPVKEECIKTCLDPKLISSKLETNKQSECQVATYLRKAGFPESSIPTMVCISKYESSYNCDATNKNTDGSTDYGLFQINSYYWCSGDPNSKYNECGASCSSLFDCQKNSNCAYKVYREQGYNAWYGYQYHRQECDNYQINC